MGWEARRAMARVGHIGHIEARVMLSAAVDVEQLEEEEMDGDCPSGRSTDLTGLHNTRQVCEIRCVMVRGCG
jgi:hypothetical protein